MSELAIPGDLHFNTCQGRTYSCIRFLRKGICIRYERYEALRALYRRAKFADLDQGMPGIGKTTSIHCLAHALLGDAYKEGVMELNASDER